MKKKYVINIISFILIGGILAVLLLFKQYKAFTWASVAAILHFIIATQRDRANRIKEYKKLLEVEENASLEDVKNAYNKKISDPSIVQEEKDKLKEIYHKLTESYHHFP